MELVPPAVCTRSRSPERAVSDDDDDGSAILIDLAPDVALHDIMQLPIAVGQGAMVAFPKAVANNPDASGRNFRKWAEDVALSAGLTVANQVVTFDGMKREGLWHQVPGHIADNFEARLQNYSWTTTLQRRSAGKYYRFAPSGPARATVTSKPILPFH